MFSCKTILCSYNGERYIIEQILSINGSFKMANSVEFSIDIFDDGSLDNTYEKVRSLQSELPQGILNFHCGENKGVVGNFLNAIVSVDTDTIDWVFLSDQDDVWVENKVLEYFHVFLKVNSNIPALVFSDSSLIDAEGQIYNPSFFSYQGLNVNVLDDDSILFRNCVQGATIALNKSMVLLLKKSLEKVSVDEIVMHDWWLAILAKYYGEYYFINKSLIYYRQHDKNEIGAKNKKNKLLSIFVSPGKYINSIKLVCNQVKSFMIFYNYYNNKSMFSNKKALTVNHCGLIKKIFVKVIEVCFFRKLS
ncbi:glycosyltransferase [Dickeya zeae]|uniref:glycosyltransferase n=1 Tax=Dickeya zeae TaxID=204042 RepID=UPI001440234C|nr:glycosyltransferase [Dickeya zeae]QIZ46008.1 glycosyltransferase [Dickeya zeae]